jgi:membrane associated rhomboid family serine protease
MFYIFYYFPLGLDVKPRREVWATWALLGACVAAFLVQRFEPQMFWLNYSAFVMIPSAPSPSSFVLNAYFHGGWMHLAANMLTLAVFGPALEDRLGSRRFLVLYHAGNVAANIVQMTLVRLFLPAMADAGVLGASGAIAGLFGLLVLRLPHAKLRVGYWTFMPLQAFTRCGTARIPVAFAIAFWFGLQLTMALLQKEGVAAGVATGSHLGGLLGGVALGLALGLHVQGDAERHLQRGKDYLDRAQWYAAQGEFIEYVRRQPKHDIGHLELARTYRLTGRHPQADQHYRIACQLLAARKQLDRVEEVYVEAERGNPRFALDPCHQFELAQAQERSLKKEAARDTFLRLCESHPWVPQAPLALYKAALLVAREPAGLMRAAHLFTRLVERYPEAREAELARIDLRALATAA